jgi:3-oxoadipate enol-lactonase
VLVLLHPIGVERGWWDEYAAIWQARYEVVAIDFRGHGASSPITAPVTLSDHAADVSAVLRHAQLGAAHVAGVSMGGMVAQCLAIEAPQQVRSLILCATAGAFPDTVRPGIRGRGDMQRAGAMAEVAENTLTRWFRADAPRPDLLERCRQRLLADDWYSWSASWEAISQLDNLAALAAVRVPALVVAAGADASIPAVLAQQLADALPAGRLVTVPDASHFGAFEERDAFMPAFDQFLSGLSR